MFLDYRLIARDGRVVWIRDDEIVVTDADGRPYAAQGYMQDVTDRRQDSQGLELLVGILSLVADETPPDEIVAHAADSLVQHFGDVQVSYVERRDDGSFHIRYTTHPGKQLFGDEVEWSADYVARLEQGAPIIVEDVSTERWLDPIRARLEGRDVVSFVDVPLLRHGKLHGVLWFSCARTRAWGEHEVSLLVDVAGQLAIVLANAEAREQRDRSERDLRNRDAILGAISSSAERFLAQPNFDDAVVELMRELGQATGATGAFVFENVEREDGVLCSVRRAGWAQENWQTTIDDPRLAHQDLPRTSRAGPRSSDAAMSSRATSATSPPTSASRSSSETGSPSWPSRSSSTGWWGFIDFDDCERERVWSAAEIDAIRAAAGLIAGAVSRERAEQRLHRRDAILEAVSHAAGLLVAATDWRDGADGLLERLGVAAGVSRAYLFENSVRDDGKLFANQGFEWVADGISPELDNESMQEMCYQEVGLTRFEAVALRTSLHRQRA